MMDTSVKKPMPLLLIDDDVAECIKYKEASLHRDDVRFVGMTASSKEGIQYVRDHMPEGVILDIELHRGVGSGLEFLDELRELELPFLPILLVITHNSSSLLYDTVRDRGVDFIFYKRQADYRADMVIDCAVALRKTLMTSYRPGMPKEMQTIESPEALKTRIMAKIEAELGLIGVGVHMKGWKYLREAIYLLIAKPGGDDDSVFSKIAVEYKVSNSTVNRTMQNAINNAWRFTSVEDLQSHYTARISYKTGVPTPTEFVFYYADKIKKFL